MDGGKIPLSLGRDCQVKCILEENHDHLVKEVLKMGAQITGVEEK